MYFFAIICFEITYTTKQKGYSLQRPGIEPGPPAWQASILPLNQRCLHVEWCCLIHYKTLKSKA